jgi:hypothetical protein
MAARSLRAAATARYPTVSQVAHALRKWMSSTQASELSTSRAADGKLREAASSPRGT